MISSLFVLATASSVFADAPDVATTDGAVTDYSLGQWVEITVDGTWAWPTHKNKDCNVDRFAAGWNVDWNDPDQPGNVVGTLNSITIDVGALAANSLNPADNAVHYPASPPRCGVYGPHGSISYNTGEWGPISHKYALPASVDTLEALNDWVKALNPCVVTYDMHLKDGGLKPGDDVAGGTGHNKDNSVEANKQTPAGNVCARINIEPLPDPDVAVVKTASASQVTVGENITYTITVTNTGQVSTSATIIDDVPTGALLVSMSDECHTDPPEYPDTVFCQLGTLKPGQSATVTITVQTTVAGTVVNTAVVTPNDETPDDNTSTVSTDVLEPAATAVNVQPNFTG
jgi:uncharacterized repeat protein (TIGR01451 family)